MNRSFIKGFTFFFVIVLTITTAMPSGYAQSAFVRQLPEPGRMLGISETFSLFVDSTLNVNGYWSQNSDGTWVNLATHIETVGGITRIDFTVTDGGAYDIDHTADGTITDNGAVGSMPLSIVGVVPVATQGGFFF